MSNIKSKELILSITAKDCRFDYYRGSGNGGQKKQKTSSACRCTHIASGAVGASQESRSQLENRKLAFTRMAETEKFQAWHKIEIARTLAKLSGKPIERPIEEVIEEEMNNIKIEIKNDNNEWIKE